MNDNTFLEYSKNGHSLVGNQTDKGLVIKCDKSYPFVSCVVLTDDARSAEVNIKSAYATGDYINVDVDKTLIDRKLNDVKQENAKTTNLEGMKLVIDFHGNEDNSVVLSEKKLALLNQAVSVAKEFLETHPKAKLYIQNQACFGADQLKVEGKKETKDLYWFLLDRLGKYKDRIFCRQGKKGYEHAASHRRHQYKDFFCFHQNKNFARIPGEEEPAKYLEDCDCYQYFALDQQDKRDDKSKSGFEGQKNKNNFFQWTKILYDKNGSWFIKPKNGCYPWGKKANNKVVENYPISNEPKKKIKNKKEAGCCCGWF